jgi:CO dehydrogenase/acetyl-CoA synthase beta subunit
LGFNSNSVAHPFKLNSLWLRDDAFSLIVQEVWNDHQFLQESGAQRRLVWKLKQLKLRVKAWAKEKRLQNHIIFEKLEEDLEFYYQQKSKGMTSIESISI